MGIEPGKHAEAITSQAQVLHGVARVTQSGGQPILGVTSPHERAASILKRQSWVGQFLSRINDTAEPLTRFEIWRLILSCVFERFLKGRIIGDPLSTAAPSLA